MLIQFLLLALSFTFASCALKGASSDSTTPRLISSDQKLSPSPIRQPDQASGEAIAEEVTQTPAQQSNVRKLNIPENQAELAETCEKQLADVPEAYKPSLTSIPLNHRALRISYNARHRIPNWVYYNLSRDNLMNSCAKRNDKFRGDPILTRAGFPKNQIINENSYKNTGFDRGHMAPSGDFTWDQEINSETFLMTNMSPQTAELNQKTWNKLEEHVRNWACGYGELKVYTGPIIENNLKRLNSCVSIPNKFFKVLLASKNKKLVGIGFIYSQTDGVGDPYKQKAVSIRAIEEASGIDFFKDDYAQKVQDEFETQFDIADWEAAEEKCYACNGVPK